MKEKDFVNLLVIPRTLVSKVLLAMHDCIFSGGHLGIRKTFERVRQRFYWRTILKDVTRYVITCPVCQKCKTRKQNAGKLMPIKTGDRPFSTVGLDIIGLLPTTRKIAICYSSKYAITRAVKNVTAYDVANFLLYDYSTY
ncbi:pol polyprotein-like protein [Leptotrombidium deliense]|uniref:RNA-directed DNA polymerase n=1 Tax=Leptotrombidium deliense TaxID=299467 RepID=A0A443QGB9_9ACAR|nr:pol polyprotein-like protein [Leptotrombidium deliense]